MSVTGDPDPVAMSDDRSISVIRAWVALYTRGLPAPSARDRRDLVDGDLWDEAEAARWLGETSGLARQRWSRWLRGVPADVSWRIEQQRRMVKGPRRLDMRISKAQLAAIGVAAIYYAVLLVGLMASPSFREWAGMPIASLGLGLCIAGLLIAIPRPQAGFLVGVVGTGLALVLMYWMVPFLLPLPIILGYRLAKEPRAIPPSASGS